MSIQTELTRITNAKSAIKTAIEGKGVTVPDGTLLDGMASLIESIEAGGGGAKVTQGSFTLTSDSNSYTIYHGLGDIPDFFVLVRNYSYTKKNNDFLSTVYVHVNNTPHFELLVRNSSRYNSAIVSNGNITSPTYNETQCLYGATQDTVQFGHNSFLISAGVPCYWFAAKTGYVYNT